MEETANENAVPAVKTLDPALHLKNDKRIVALLAKTGTKAHVEEKSRDKWNIVIDWWKQWNMEVKVKTVFVDSLPRELPVLKTDANAVLYALERFGWKQVYIVRADAIDQITASGAKTFSIDDIPCKDYLFYDMLKARVMDV